MFDYHYKNRCTLCFALYAVTILVNLELRDEVSIISFYDFVHNVR